MHYQYQFFTFSPFSHYPLGLEAIGGFEQLIDYSIFFNLSCTF
ncbi:hypothetical protein [Candidatus Methylacidiphilum infernorum]|nr:hypothetical protein [Candidatus Methylacidiphilum infernorum]